MPARTNSTNAVSRSPDEDENGRIAIAGVATIRAIVRAFGRFR
jgi:hypothetical protein